MAYRSEIATCVQDVTLDRLKVFLATILKFGKPSQTEPVPDAERDVHPTDQTWRYLPDHVIAILDVDFVISNINAGSVRLTADSFESTFPD